MPAGRELGAVAQPVVEKAPAPASQKEHTARRSPLGSKPVGGGRRKVMGAERLRTVRGWKEAPPSALALSARVVVPARPAAAATAGSVKLSKASDRNLTRTCMRGACRRRTSHMTLHFLITFVCDGMRAASLAIIMRGGAYQGRAARRLFRQGIELGNGAGSRDDCAPERRWIGLLDAQLEGGCGQRHSGSGIGAERPIQRARQHVHQSVRHTRNACGSRGGCDLSRRSLRAGGTGGVPVSAAARSRVTIPLAGSERAASVQQIKVTMACGRHTLQHGQSSRLCRAVGGA